jgi:MoxR-like ATPase
MNADVKELSQKAAQLSGRFRGIREEINKVIVGQHYVLDRLLMGLLCDSHVLLEGMPGLAKTLMVHTLANITHASFKRIQFTPDLLPADIIGTKVYNQKTMEFTTSRGPIFTNFILADEVNRAPPKVQSALLEAMQERQVTIGGETIPLQRPFLVLATQNPVEVEGTYPLPEAQVDRFMFKVIVKYPSRGEEIAIMTRMTTGEEIKTEAVLHPKDILAYQKFVHSIYVDEKIKEYVADLIFATREPASYGFEDLSDFILYGASPRASIYLIHSAKACALLSGRGYVTPDDVKEVFFDVLRHRLILSYEAEAEEVSVEDILEKILEKTDSP